MKCPSIYDCDAKVIFTTGAWSGRIVAECSADWKHFSVYQGEKHFPEELYETYRSQND